MQNSKNPVDQIKADVMDIYKKDVMDRLEALSDQEKQILVEFTNTPAAQVISKVLGPELAGAEAAVLQDQPQTEEQPSLPLEMPKKRAGLGAR